MKTTYIYALIDPNTDEIRYIGKSNNPKARYAVHISLNKNDTNKHKKRWIRGLLKSNQEPILKILEKVQYSKWEERERYWIDHGRDEGWPLTNIADGGVAPSYVATRYNLYQTLAEFLPENEHGLLDHLSLERLTEIAVCMAKESIPLLRGYFLNKSVGRGDPYDVCVRVIRRELGI